MMYDTTITKSHTEDQAEDVMTHNRNSRDAFKRLSSLNNRSQHRKVLQDPLQ